MPEQIENKSPQRNLITTLISIAVIIALVYFMSSVYAEIRIDNTEEVVKGPGVTDTGMLSDYLPNLEGTVADTEVYFMEGDEPGATIFIMGGNHPDEPAGVLTSILFIENAEIDVGRVIVAPHSNNSAFQTQPAGEAHPMTYEIETDWGSRRFRYTERITSQTHQYPDPDAYVHPTGQVLAGFEVRNINRSFPGREDGLLTERMAYAFTNIVHEEEVDLFIDIHEARPMNPIVNCIIAADEAMPLASDVSLFLEIEEGIDINVEDSPVGLRGLTHREIADHTNAYSVLLETPNPAMDNLRGPTNEELIVGGKDDFYRRADEIPGLIHAPYEEGVGYPMDMRVGRHASTVLMLFDVFSDHYPDNPIRVSNFPRKAEIMENGVGHYLLEP